MAQVGHIVKQGILSLAYQMVKYLMIFYTETTVFIHIVLLFIVLGSSVAQCHSVPVYGHKGVHHNKRNAIPHPGARQHIISGSWQ